VELNPTITLEIKMGMKLALIMGAVMITMGLAFSWYYKDTQERMGVLRENAAKLEVAVRANEEALAATQADAARNAALNLELQTKLQVSEKYGDELRATLQKHNLTMLAIKKPGLIEQRMNDATKKLFDDIITDTTN
jgi:predicted TPR repeat methyltransferase